MASFFIKGCHFTFQGFYSDMNASSFKFYCEAIAAILYPLQGNGKLDGARGRRNVRPFSTFSMVPSASALSLPARNTFQGFGCFLTHFHLNGHAVPLCRQFSHFFRVNVIDLTRGGAAISQLVDAIDGAIRIVVNRFGLFSCRNNGMGFTRSGI